MSLRVFPFLIALLICAPALHADDAATTEVIPPYELKNHSTFAKPADISRVPFWPIGWVKRVAGAPVAAVVPVAAPVLLDGKNFRVTSILIGTGSTPSLAVINQRAYSEGEFIRMRKAPGVAPVRIRVQRINDGTVILQNGDQLMVAPLVRPELSSKRPDEQLLDPDR